MRESGHGHFTLLTTPRTCARASPRLKICPRCWRWKRASPATASAGAPSGICLCARMPRSGSLDRAGASPPASLSCFARAPDMRVCIRSSPTRRCAAAVSAARSRGLPSDERARAVAIASGSRRAHAMRACCAGTGASIIPSAPACLDSTKMARPPCACKKYSAAMLGARGLVGKRLDVGHEVVVLAHQQRRQKVTEVLAPAPFAHIVLP